MSNTVPQQEHCQLLPEVTNADIVLPSHIPGKLAAKPGCGFHHQGSLEWGDHCDIESSVFLDHWSRRDQAHLKGFCHRPARDQLATSLAQLQLHCCLLKEHCQKYITCQLPCRQRYLVALSTGGRSIASLLLSPCTALRPL